MAEGRPSAGDLTGKIKFDQAKESLQEVRDRSAEMSLATAIEAEEQETGVFDPHDQKRLDIPVVVEETLPSEGFYRAEPRQQEPVFTGYESEEQMAPYLATRNEPVVPQAVVRDPRVKIRVTQDIEDMTYGMTPQGAPNNMTFREGYIYEVDINIAEHLNQRGLVQQWVS